MNPGARLPETDESGFFEIRFESIGGLGANLAGQILGRAAVLKMGLNGAHFSSYGSEKKGSPIKSYVRLCAAEHEVHASNPIEHPHVLVIFHETLLANPKTAAGLRPGGILVLNTRKTMKELEASYCVPADAQIWTLDALWISVEERSRVNAVLLGALARILEFLDGGAILDTLTETFRFKNPAVAESNRRAFQRGRDEVRRIAGADDRRPRAARSRTARQGPLYGYKTAPLGGVIVNPGNTVFNDLTASRLGFLPVFNSDLCNHCGLCDLVCPDYCLVWEHKKSSDPISHRLIGVDYQYCKGCMRCVESCPTGALSKTKETEGFAREHRVRLFPDLRR